MSGTSALSDALRVLTFRADGAALAALDGRHLRIGLLATWLVGMGRWWDDPRAVLVQKLGLGSVAYVFALATVLWLLLLPLRPAGLSWKGVLTYVTLTAPPAALYAIPIERWTTVETAMTVNLWFLAVVAAWRVALVAVWLTRGLRLGPFVTASVVLLPVIFVVWAMVEINPERAVGFVFDVMGGVRDRPPPTPGDAAFEVLQHIAVLGWLLFLPLLFAYLGSVSRAQNRRRALRRADQQGAQQGARGGPLDGPPA